MNNYHQPRAGIHPQKRMVASFVVGERVRIVNAPTSYGYKAGVVEAIDGSQISVRLDEHPADLRCNVFSIEELEREEAL